MSTAAPPARYSRNDLIKAFVASLSGTSLEWYDFAAYSAASALVFGQLFFPSHDPLSGTLLAFSTYAVGYLSRPLGGFLFGRLGDVLGRKQVLVTTLLLTGIATVLIGLLPTHSQVGPVGGLLLVVLRFAQGVGLGGEWGGAVLLSSEFGDERHRGLWASAAQLGPPTGNLLAQGALGLLAAMLTQQQFLSWGWRVAFILSATLVIFGLWIRVKLEETPVFQEIQRRGDRAQAPLREVFTREARALVAGILARIGPDVLYALFTVFVLTYATTYLHLPKSTAVVGVLAGSALQLPLIPVAGALSDRWGRIPVYLVGVLGGGVWPFVFFPAVEGGSPTTLVGGVIVGLLWHSLMYGPQAALVSEQFSPRLRYTGCSLAYTLAGVLGGALAPLLFTSLFAGFHTWLAPACYLAATCVLTLIGLAVARPRTPQPAPPDPAPARSGTRDPGRSTSGPSRIGVRETPVHNGDSLCGEPVAKGGCAMRIALCQISATAEPPENLELVADGTRRAAEAGAELAVFPEATMARFGVSLGPLAEPLDGPWATELRRIARESGITVVAGMFTPTADGRVTNTLLATGPEVETHYDKIHLYDAFGFSESRTVAAGEHPVTLDLGDTRIGLSTCYDIRFPGLYTTLADRGASVIVTAASWGSGEGKRAQWDLLARARALDSTSWVVACGQADPLSIGRRPSGKAPNGIGYSAVVSPLGEIRDQLADAPDLLIADIAPQDVEGVRETLPVLQNRQV